MVTSCENTSLCEETTLIERLQKGDICAVGEFVQQHRTSFLQQIERNLSAGVRSKVEPEDLLQEVTLAAIRTVGRHGLRTPHAYRWFRRLIRQRIVSAYRRYFLSHKRAAHREVSFHGVEDSGWITNQTQTNCATPSEALNQREQMEKIWGVCGRLSDTQQQLLALRFQQGLSSKEIGDRMDKSDGAVRVMLSRTLTKVRRLLEIAE